MGLRSLACMLVALNFLTWQPVAADIFNGPTKLQKKSFEVLTVNGPANLYKISADKLTVNGPTVFEKVTIKEFATFVGPTKGKKSSFKNLDVKGPFAGMEFDAEALKIVGPVALAEFTIKNKAEITGELKASKGTFQDLTMLGGYAQLEDIKVKSITFVSGSEDRLILSGQTVIFGDINFASGHGQVIKKSAQVKIEGKISGGELILAIDQSAKPEEKKKTSKEQVENKGQEDNKANHKPHKSDLASVHTYTKS